MIVSDEWRWLRAFTERWEYQLRLGEVASYPVPGSGSPKAEYTGAADGFEVEGNLKDKRKRFILRCGLPLLSFDDREGLIASIQRRAGEEEINGELVPLRMGVDGGLQWFPKWAVPFSWQPQMGFHTPSLYKIHSLNKTAALGYSERSKAHPQLPKKEQENLYYLPQLPKEPHQEQELVPHVPQDRQEWDIYLKQQ